MMTFHENVPQERSDKQPEYFTPSYRSEHCLALFGTCSLTKFALNKQQFKIPPVGQKIYKTLSPIVDEMTKDKRLMAFTAPEKQLVFFDDRSWHKGVEATKTGFRFFIRATVIVNSQQKMKLGTTLTCTCLL